LTDRRRHREHASKDGRIVGSHCSLLPSATKLDHDSAKQICGPDEFGNERVAGLVVKLTRLALSNCSVPEIASITGHSMKTVQEILDAHYLGGRVELAESTIKKLSEVYG
jgi:hypothetical protein